MVRNGHSCVWRFWDGWFNRWERTDYHGIQKELAEAVREVLEPGSINLYMFHGGTNFGFMDGCSARGTLDLPQVTSYDYDALLDEEGNPTAKYMAVKEDDNTFPRVSAVRTTLQGKYGSWMLFHWLKKFPCLKPWIACLVSRKPLS